MVDSEIKDGVAIIPEGITEVGCGTNPNSCTKLDIINNGYNSNCSSPSNDTGDNEEINAKETLKNNTMFHFSLGSKELFHSNFLHWLSIIKPTEFLNLMHEFAGISKFWWEDCYTQKEHGTHCEVRRESDNFDLSIWINLKAVPQDPESSKWVPVLVLENKMKSLTRKDQLEGYVQKAYEKWGKRDLKNKQEDKQNSSPIITFILLTLVEDKNNYDVGFDFTIGRKKQRQFNSNWAKKTYNDLASSLDKFLKKDNSLNDQIINSYKGFIKAMCVLGKSWSVNNSTEWKNILSQDDLNDIRINDIHQKLVYSQIERLLINELGTDIKEVKTGSGFSNGSGLVEASVIKVEKGLTFMVQVQGRQYRRAIIGTNKDAVAEAANNRDLWGKFFCFEDKNLDYEFPFDNDIKPKENKHPKSKSSYGKLFNYYGQSFAYQYVDIPDGTSVEKVINAMITDITKN